VTVWPFVKSARLLSAEGHPADAVIEMWRPNTDAWALRGHLDSVAATIIDGETASRLRQERFAVHDREKSDPSRGLVLVPVHPRAVSGAADDNGERGNVKPDVHHGARQAYWASVLFLITPKRRAHGASVPTDQSWDQEPCR
jgi:hypothetical protein